MDAVIDRLNIHGIRMTRLTKPTELKLQQYKLSNPVFNTKDFEGHQTVKAESELTKVSTTLPAGTIKNQHRSTAKRSGGFTAGAAITRFFAAMGFL